MGIFDGRRPTIKVDPPRPRLRINNGTGVDPADIAKRVTEARDRISVVRAIDPLLPPPIPKINLSLGRSLAPKLQAEGLEDLPNQLQSIISKADFGKYKFTFGQQDSLLNPKVVSGADVIRNTPIYLAGNEGVRQAGFSKSLEVAYAHHFSVDGPHITEKISKLARIENLPTLTRRDGQVPIEGFIHIDPTNVGNFGELSSKVEKIANTTFHELGHAVSSQAGRSQVSSAELYKRSQLILDHFKSGGTVPNSTLAVGQPVNLNTIADYFGETLGTRLKQNAIEEARADTMNMVGRAMRGNADYSLQPITGTIEEKNLWQTLWREEKITAPSSYHYKASFLSHYATPFSQYHSFVDSPNGPPIVKKIGGISTLEDLHDNVIRVFERHPEWSNIGEKEKSRLMSRVATVADARAKAAYLAHLAAPEGMEQSAAVSMIMGLQTNVESFDRNGINFLQMFREEAENAGGLNATMLTAESADQTIVAKSFGSWMKRVISSANATEREKAPIGSISSIKGIRGVGKAAANDGSYAVTESLRAVGKGAQAAPRSAVMTATTLERMLESAATALKVVRKV